MKQLILPAVLLATALILAPAAQADIKAGLKAREDGQWEQAFEEFEKDLENPSTRFEANWRIGESLVMIGQSKDALEFLEAAVKENPNHAEAQYWWGAANGEVAGDASIFSAPGYAKASLRALEKAVALDADHLDARAALVQYYLQAPGFLGGDPDKAIAQAQAIMERDKQAGYLSLASVYTAEKQPEQALATYDKLLTEFPNDSGGLLARGLTHRHAKRYGAAYADFKRLATIDPTDEKDALAAADRTALGLYFIGAISSNQNVRRTEGIQSLLRFLARGDFDIPIRKNYAEYYLATLYLADGNKSDARTFLRKANKGALNKDLKKRLKKLKKHLKKT